MNSLSKTESLPPQQSDFMQTLKRIDAIWVFLIVLFLLAAISTEGFFSTTNLLNVFRAITIVGIAAAGMTLVLIGGNFDLSTGAIIALAAVISLSLQPVTPGLTLLAIAVPLFAGLGAGFINGYIVGGLGANSIVTTIGSQFVIMGALLIGVSGAHVRVDGATAFYEALANGSSFGIPNPVYLLIVIVAVAHLLMTRFSYGRHLTAIGGSEIAARVAGVRTKRVVLSSFMISGLLAAVSGVLVASRVRNLDPTQGIGYEFQALTAVVLGGTRLTGGYGSVLNTLAAALILGIIANVMVLNNVKIGTQLMVQGLILVAAVAYHSYRQIRA